MGDNSARKAAAAAERRWHKDTRERTAAKREQTAAEAVAGAASLRAPGIVRAEHNGDETVVYLREGATLDVHVPGMGRIAVIQAGDGWATAIVSPRVMRKDSGEPAGDPGDGWRAPWSHVRTVPWVPYAATTLPPLPAADDEP